MSTAFISNSNLKELFPSALSTNASKFTSEKNITGIVRAVVDNNSYIISGPSGANNEYEFVLNGYYFKIIYSNIGQNLWVGIYTDDHDRLIGFTGTGQVTTEMSDGTNFRGLLLGTTETDVIKTVGGGYNSYRLQIVKDGQLNKEAMYKFTQGSIKGVSTYDPESDDPVSSKAIKAAIETLDVAAISGTSGQTITSISETDGKISATFGNISITKSQVSDFSHTHGNINNDGTMSSQAISPANGDFILISDNSNSGKIEKAVNIGTDTTKFLRNDGTWQTPSGTFSLQPASENVLGGIKIGYTTNNTNRNYAVQLDSNSNKAYVNVPWTENINYTGTSPISVSGSTISHATSGVTAKNTLGLYQFTVNNTGHITSVSSSAVNIPTVNNATLTITKNGDNNNPLGTFTANASTNKTINIPVPVVTSGNSLPSSGNTGDIFILY